ncbi:deoxyribodipyrimidine photo-lyase [Rhodospirillales bacterium YIM 152171]|uniref:Deoxyribodipyrimidine photo-lyase n=1 Tax=Marinimicrococcus flavescens TaxID=3031815 RepID=A0AAP3XRS6_9PROT|nr:deoxyribodipyrimidine photo-lyase [Marinimicrococcus flavescens]
MAASEPALVWFRQDLRLADNPALVAAARSGRPVLAAFVLDDESPGVRPAGGASRWWLHHSLEALAAALQERGVRLVLRRGPAEREIRAVAAEIGVREVFWSRRYEPWSIAVERRLEEVLASDGIELRTGNALLAFEPWEIAQKGGGPYKVFTPYWRAWSERGAPPAPLPAPGRLEGFAGKVTGDALADWALLPHKPDWAGGLRETWTPGEASALDAAETFLDGPVLGYAQGRDRPAGPGTSRLSPHLHWGEISPRQLWHAARLRCLEDETRWGRMLPFIRQLAWRDFAYHSLWHFPDLAERPMRPEFERFPWRDDEAGFRAWSRGRTGYPMVDAGMRELWHTGWMHNRLRMITASFLVKDLLIPWQRGEAWFRDTLCDADCANNAMGWQWVAGCGIDTAPFFRIFNPVTQGERHDPEGSYVRQWVPELARLPKKWIHNPSAAPPAVLREAGVTLGRDYPEPIVDHARARERALEAYGEVRG